MKNNLFNTLSVLALSSLVFVSCSKDDEETTPAPTPETKVSNLYASSNGAGAINVYNVLNTAAPTTNTIAVANENADGIYYDAATDRLFQYDRSNNRLNAYTNASSLSGTASPAFSIDVPAANGREITVSGNTLVLASNSDLALFVYSIGDNAFTFQKQHTTIFESWGIQLVGNTLYAVVDKTSDLAVFNNFTSATAGPILANKTVTIEGIVRTHGLNFVSDKNMMLMTDVADAASGTDGAIHIIKDFTTKLANTANGGTIAITDQIRIDGAASLLGNPVDVAYDANNNRIYTAEAKNGTVLGFDMPASNSQAAPTFNAALAGASAVYMHN